MPSKSKKKVIEEEEEEEMMMEEEEEDHVILIDVLTEKGISSADISKFKTAGYLTVKSLLTVPKKLLLDVKGISEAKCDKVLGEAHKICDTGFKNGIEYEKELAKKFTITSGCKEIDLLLNGGFESMTITSIHGPSRCGKTQICLTLSVTAQLDKASGGGNGKVLYLDCTSSFSPQRIRTIAKRFGVNEDDALNNISVAEMNSVDDLPEAIKAGRKFMAEDHYSLLIVDGFMNLYRSNFVGRGELAARQNHLQSFLNNIRRTAKEYNVAVVFTNVVVANPDGMFSASAPAPSGGHVLSHSIDTSLQLRKARGNNRIMKIFSAVCLEADKEASFTISDEGIVDSS